MDEVRRHLAVRLLLTLCGDLAGRTPIVSKGFTNPEIRMRQLAVVNHNMLQQVMLSVAHCDLPHMEYQEGQNIGKCKRLVALDARQTS